MTLASERAALDALRASTTGRCPRRLRTARCIRWRGHDPGCVFEADGDRGEATHEDD